MAYVFINRLYVRPNAECEYMDFHLSWAMEGLLFIDMMFNVTLALSGYISNMNYSMQESHNRDTVQTCSLFSDEKWNDALCGFTVLFIHDACRHVQELQSSVARYTLT